MTLYAKIANAHIRAIELLSHLGHREEHISGRGMSACSPQLKLVNEWRNCSLMSEFATKMQLLTTVRSGF